MRVSLRTKRHSAKVRARVTPINPLNKSLVRQLSQVSPGISLGDARRVALGGARPCFLGEAAVPLHARERRARALRRIIAALQLIVIVGLLLLLILILVAREDVAVA